MQLDQGVPWHGASSLLTSKTTGALGKGPEGGAPEGTRWEPGEDGNGAVLHAAGVLRAAWHTEGRPQCVLNVPYPVSRTQ